MQYVVRRIRHKPPGSDIAWQDATIGTVAEFRPESSAHRPETTFRLAYSEQGLHGLFEVQDRFVRCVRTAYGEEVWKDSCVEFFVKPKADQGYFNFEFNCGGAWLCSYITNPERTPDGFKQCFRLPETLARQVRVVPSLPRIVDPEILDPTDWSLRFFIPFAVLEDYCGTLRPVKGQAWRGNFYKCAEETSHPHWAAWAAVDELNFHLPRCFGELRFE